MKEAYTNCLKTLRYFRKRIKTEKDLPISSKKPKEYKKIEQDYKERKITFKEFKNKKSEITEIVQLNSIYRFKDMIRWVNITRMRKISILRLNFKGSIGKIDGKYMNEISEKISLEF